jgi:hypothetical protein
MTNNNNKCLYYTYLSFSYTFIIKILIPDLPRHRNALCHSALR